jgi:hypothetical protein
MDSPLSQAIFGGGQEQPASASPPSLMSLAAAELERMGPPQAEKYSEVFPGDEKYGPSPKESLMEALPEMLGADELRDENDILYIANAALMEGKKDPADLISWLARKEMLAKMARPPMWIEDSKYQRPPPRISQIAKFLRFEAQARR